MSGNIRELLMKIFVYEISHLKNVEYDINNLIQEFKEFDPEERITSFD